jgi:hypothetical protein
LSLPNHDCAAPVRCNCRLCIVVSFKLPSICTACR